jgi:hypothetical protein
MEYNNESINTLMKVCLVKKYHKSIDIYTKNAKRIDYILNGENTICFYNDTFLIISIDLNNNRKIWINTNILQRPFFNGDADYVEGLVENIFYISDWSKAIIRSRKRKLEQITLNVKKIESVK